MYSNHVSVAIVGAGPTGLTAALCLKKMGIECRIIDKRSGPVITSNALGVQPRTLEIWQSLGIAEEALARGRKVTGLNNYNEREKIFHVSLKDIPSPFPFILGLPQTETEQILLAELAKMEVTIERETEMLTLKEHTDKVELTCRNQEKEFAFTANWVLGCDGSHSKVRELLNISYQGSNLPQHFIMADLPLFTEFPPDEMHSFLSKHGAMVMIPLKSFYRLILDVTHLPDLKEVKNPPLTTFVPLVKERCFIPLTLQEPLWTSSFWIHEHVAQRYKQGRVCLLGDAAHEHSPVGGQGMNTGIQDAFNLCWKLALHEQKKANSILIESYEEERQPIAKMVVKLTTLGTKVITSSLPGLKAGLQFLVKHLTAIPFISQNIAKTFTHLKVNYERSRISGQSGNWKEGIKAGDRVPFSVVTRQGQSTSIPHILAKDKFTLLLFTNGLAPTTPEFEQLVALAREQQDKIKCYLVSTTTLASDIFETLLDETKSLHQEYGVDKPCYYLIRPDLYVAFRDANCNATELKEFMKKIGLS